MSVDRSHIPEFAFYYGDWIWTEDLIDWAKSLLLFFDGIALALPRKTAEQFIDSDPILARPLSDRGLLQNFDRICGLNLRRRTKI